MTLEACLGFWRLLAAGNETEPVRGFGEGDGSDDSPIQAAEVASGGLYLAV